jgi:hypothetical protein
MQQYDPSTSKYIRVRSGGDCMVIGFTTTYAISAYHHWCCEFESRSERDVWHYVIKFVSDLRQLGGFLRFPPPRYDWNIVESGIKHHKPTIKVQYKMMETGRNQQPDIDKLFVQWSCYLVFCIFSNDIAIATRINIYFYIFDQISASYDISIWMEFFFWGQ